jgi:hypothetical protein
MRTLPQVRVQCVTGMPLGVLLWLDHPAGILYVDTDCYTKIQALLLEATLLNGSVSTSHQHATQVNC